MIRYALRCDNAHDFESWFQSASAYESLRAGGMVACPECGDTGVEKALMAPQVRATRQPAQTGAQPDATKLAELKRKIEANSDYVGGAFAAEARAMHMGEKPHRSIYGEARLDEAKALVEEGVPVAPLPFMPTRRTN